MANVLLVDDDAVFLSLLASGLKAYGEQFTVLTAADGQAAIDIFQKRQIALLVTDIMMPRVDGLSLLAYIHEHHPAVPCFVMTAFETPHLKKVLPRDIVRFYRKPVSAEKLGPAILRSLKETGPRGAVHGITVVSFLQMIEMEKKTCLFEVHLPEEADKGLFFFEKGVLCDVIHGDQKGETAALALLSEKRATFKFKAFPKKKIAKRMALSVRQLIEKKYGRPADDTPASDPTPAVETGPTPDQTGDFFPEVPPSGASPDAAPPGSAAGKPLNLPGLYRSPKHGQGHIKILHLSRSGLLFAMENPEAFDPEEQLEVEFTLDDALNSLVRKTAYVVATQGARVSVRFKSTDHYDALGGYLLYRNIKQEVLFDP